MKVAEKEVQELRASISAIANATGSLVLVLIMFIVQAFQAADDESSSCGARKLVAKALHFVLQRWESAQSILKSSTWEQMNAEDQDVIMQLKVQFELIQHLNVGSFVNNDMDDVKKL